MPAESLATDVLVVGGGPAGLSAAWAAARGGARTLLLAREAEIGGPIRTSGATWLADLADLGLPAHLAHPVDRVRFVAPDTEAAWRFPRPVAGVLDVRGLYQHLAAEAARAGATLRLRHTATAPLLDDGRVVGVEARDDRGRDLRVRAVVSVDASGSAGALATRAGLRPPFRRLGVGAEQEVLAPAWDQRTAALLVGRGIAPRGYAWAFPRGNGRVRVGVGIIRPDADLDPRALLERLWAHPALAADLAGAQPLEYHLGTIPAEPPATRLSLAGLLAAGDAAAQASPLVGEGIRYAIRAGRLAGAAAAEAVRAGDASGAALARRYDGPWRRRFGRELATAYWLNRRLSRYGDRNWRVVAAMLDTLDAPMAAAALRGDLSAGWWLRLAARAPALVLATGRALRHG